jgi:hypothetical protein
MNRYRIARKTTVTMPYEFGDVILVPFPSTNQATFKQPPAAIVCSQAFRKAYLSG